MTTTGIVTQVGNGYYLQDPTGDGNDATSDAIFVFTGSAPAVAVGDAVQVSGKVSEFTADPGVGLSITEIDARRPRSSVHGNALPAAVLIGTGGRLPPNMVIDDDGLTSFDPATDGIDFYESMEGMRVTIDNAAGRRQHQQLRRDLGGRIRRRRRDRSLPPAAASPSPTAISIPSGSRSTRPRSSPATRRPLCPGRPCSRASPASSITASTSYEVLVTATDPAIRQPSTLAARDDRPRWATPTISRSPATMSRISIRRDGQDKFDLLARNIVFNLARARHHRAPGDPGRQRPGTGVISAYQELANLLRG